MRDRWRSPCNYGQPYGQIAIIIAQPATYCIPYTTLKIIPENENPSLTFHTFYYGSFEHQEMSRCFNPLPRILEERETSSEQQLPEVRKVSWTAHNISQEWLKRMSAIISVKSDIESINSDVISVSKYNALKHRDFSRRSRKCHDYISTVGSPKEAGSNSKSSIEETSRRKPDSMYISLVSRSTNEVPVLPRKSHDRHFT